MSDLLDKLKKSGSITSSGILSKSVYFSSKESVTTSLPILNIAFSGKIDGGFSAGITILAGVSRVFKSLLGLYAMQAYLTKYQDGIALLYDSEFGTPPEYIHSLGIDTDRVIHIPVTNIEELTFDMTKRLQEIQRGDKVFIFVDSLGNLASKREFENAINENSAKDMSRAQTIKSFFRIITPHITMKDIPCFVINHVYSEQNSLYPKTIVSGGCLVAGTEVIMADGTLRKIEDIKQDEYVKTLYGDKRVYHVWDPKTLGNGHPRCLKLIFSDGFKVTCSETHKFMLPTGKWIEAKDTTEGSHLRTPDNGKVMVVDITDVGEKDVYDISVKDAEHYFLKNGLVSHNSGPMLSANTIFIITKSQEKAGTEVIGYNFNINIEKSRFVREKSKFSFTALYDTGIQKYSGLLDIALESGDVIKPSNGWYARVNTETGETSGKLRLKDTYTDEFWEPILKSEHFNEFIKNRYMLCAKQMEQHDTSKVDSMEEFLDESEITE